MEMTQRPKTKHEALARLWALEQELKDLRTRIENLRGMAYSPRSRSLNPDLRDRAKSPLEDLLTLEKVLHGFFDCLKVARFDRGDEVKTHVQNGPHWLYP